MKVDDLRFFCLHIFRLWHGSNCMGDEWVQGWWGLCWEGMLQSDCQVFADGGCCDSDVLPVCGIFFISCVEK